MSEVTSIQPLKYYSFGLSTCLHLILLFFFFAFVYHATTQLPFPPASQLAQENDEYIEVPGDESEHEQAQELSEPSIEPEPQAQADTLAEAPAETPEQQQTIEPSPTESPVDTQEPVLTPAEATEIAAPAQPVHARRRARQNRWKKEQTAAPTASGISSGQRLTPSQQAGQALSSGFSSFIQQENQGITDRLASRGKTMDQVSLDRHDYHTRVLEAIKETTRYFVKKFYAQHQFTTPKIRVSFSLDDTGKITDLSLTPSSGNFELDQAIRQFVASTHFPKKPETLTIIRDTPYDFYILPLTMQVGENLLKLVPCF